MECRQIESLLPPYVDGEADARTRQAVEAHLATCPACRGRAVAERTARAVVRARAPQLVVVAPPGLRTRLDATLRMQRATSLGWRGRVTAFAAAAVLILMVIAGLELATPQSNVLFAAQLAIDHMRCFVVALTATAPADATVLSQQLSKDYGWSITVPPSDAAAGVTLVAARRCPFWLGPHAHLLYRTGDHEVSLYVTPGGRRDGGDLRVLGHVEKLWSAGGHSYALVTGDLPDADLQRVSSYLERETHR
jgi:anti-sigma factor RsiW